MWPLEEREEAGVPDRLRTFLEKAAREAKTHSSWLTPNAAYERAMQDFAVGILEHETFAELFRRFQKKVAFHGALNALSQVLLKACSPGVPDFYQGTELWDFSLVDPDNRRPVDYERRTKLLASLRNADPSKLLRHWKDGRVKLFVTARTLDARKRHLEAFQTGSYGAVDAGRNCVAFTRGDSVLVAVPRLTTELVNPPRFPLGDVWGETTLAVGGSWRNVYTGEKVRGDHLALREVFATFPVALLEQE
jgi:(1->4)-alpha-D-glucan 1-alpha-D-glucosylmutase